MTIPCSRCGAPQEDGVLVCASCGSFVHQREMTELMHRARALESRGRPADALADWKRILDWLTPEAQQRAAVEREVCRLQALLPLATAGTPEPVVPRKRGRIGGLVALLGIVLSKVKLLLLGLGKFKTVLSMAVMAGLYTSFYGWPFAVGIVLLIYLHEMGHILAIKQRGLEASWPVFIPFVGAFVRLRSQPRSASEDAYIGYAGPLFGSIAAAAVWGVAWATNSQVLTALAFFGFYINFFNLIAIPPLDGGRVTHPFGRAQWLLTLGALWAGVAFHHEGLVILLAIVATFRGLLVIFGRAALPPFFDVPSRERWSAAVAYAALALVLIASMKLTLPERDPATLHPTVASIPDGSGG